MFENIDDSNFSMIAMKFYDNPQCMDLLEFQDDLNRIKYIKRLFRRYRETGELKERLILNHLIVLYNVFEPTACTKMLVFKLYEYLDFLKPFLIYINYWPTQITGIGFEGITIKDDEVELNALIVERLREI